MMSCHHEDGAKTSDNRETYPRHTTHNMTASLVGRRDGLVGVDYLSAERHGADGQLSVDVQLEIGEDHLADTGEPVRLHTREDSIDVHSSAHCPDGHLSCLSWYVYLGLALVMEVALWEDKRQEEPGVRPREHGLGLFVRQAELFAVHGPQSIRLFAMQPVSTP